MRLVQFINDDGQRRVATPDDDGRSLRLLTDVERIYELALLAGREQVPLKELAEERLGDETVEYETVITEKRLLPPLDHPQPARCYVTGTGLSHLGSAQARDQMHAKSNVQDGSEEERLTDSMKLFRWGLEGGKPEGGSISVQPEWFYKGNGHCLVAPEQPISSPNFALDAGEESELVGIYVIGDHGEVLRVGFALGNEFADHVMERQNYLYLAHSKLRRCSVGPELRLGQPPGDVRGEVQIVRDEEVVWRKEFLTGEENMSYTFANLEHHHFKYDMFRRPGDLHLHFFGTATLSFSDGIQLAEGDRIDIACPDFGEPLRNSITLDTGETRRISVRTL